MFEARVASETIKFVDDYCEWYKKLFPEVRSFEAFKYLHIGMISDIKRKTLPAISRVVGLSNEQGLLHFLTESPWKLSDLREARLKLILQVLAGREIILIIDETGDKKKGSTTDYVKRQYIGNLGKIDNGIVAVTAYGLFEGMTFPLSFEVYKPKQRLLEEDTYQSKPQIAAKMIRELQAMGFKFQLVLADSLYGESDSNFLSVLYELQLDFVVAIRSNHGVWLPKGQKVRYNRWRPYNRVFSDGKQEKRYIREIVFGKRRALQYWQVTTDPETLPENSTWFIMTKVPGIKYKEVGNLYGLRNWVEYGLKQSKNELGWADFRVTNYSQIQKWWEIVMSAYLMVSLHAQVLNNNPEQGINKQTDPVVARFPEHEWWDFGSGWKNLLNNLRLVIQPFIFFSLLKPWLRIFPISHLSIGFLTLIALMNRMRGAIPDINESEHFLFSSA
ncbi:IS701 family transposase [Fischerella thermalis]|uniref:IS701 family transposase n=1 Tax=Fischerella thermalis TaxID=372787 RepID=UPI0019DC2270|nr:IS701 family transposase [Fischerella thermalis]MBF2062503.1 IS701 family transposase [Fischerella thermalis M66_A2018_004]